MASRHGGAMPTSTHSFNVFFEGWLARQQALLDQLIAISSNKTHVGDPPTTKDQLIEQVLAHYGEYYEEKNRIMRQDVFLIFSPSWLTSFEKAFLWVAGFKPTFAFRLVDTTISNMVSEQVYNMKRLKAETIREEQELTDLFASVQETVGAPPLMDLARRVGRLVDGEISDFADAIDQLKDAMVEAVEKADGLRRRTVMKVVEILNQDQTVEFLTAVAKYQLGVRAWGIQKDLQRESTMFL